MRLWFLGLCACLLLAGCRSVPKAESFDILPQSQVDFLDTPENRDLRVEQFIQNYPDYTEQNKIHYLLYAIQDSPYSFYRNGSEYKSSEAMRWLRWKIQKGYYDAPLDTAWNFIHYVANGSRASGRKYRVIFPDKTYANLDDVLSNELKWLEDQLNDDALHKTASRLNISAEEGMNHPSSVAAIAPPAMPVVR